MSRHLVEVEIEGSKLNAILDTGAWRSYIRSELVEGLPVVPVEPSGTLPPQVDYSRLRKGELTEL